MMIALAAVGFRNGDITYNKEKIEGYPKPLCKADKLYYVTTAGGAYVPEEFGYGYIKALAQNFYGIKDCEKIQAVELDVVGADVEAIVNECIDKINI